MPETDGRNSTLKLAGPVRRRFCALGVLAILLVGCLSFIPSGLSHAEPGEVTEGLLHYTRYDDHPNVKVVAFRFDGETFELGKQQPIASTRGADGILFAPDGDLIVGGQGQRVHKIRADGSGDHRTLDLDGVSSFHVSLDPSGRRLWSAGLPGKLAEISLTPFGSAIGHALTGDDLEITHIAFDDNGQAYYTASDYQGHGSFGQIDLERFVTRRLIDGLEAAHGLTFDGFTGDFMLFGGNEIAQIDPDDPSVVKSRVSFATSSQFDQGTTDGQGHLFAAHNDGYLVFIDYAASGRVEDPENYSATVFVDSHLDDIAPLSGLGADPAALSGETDGYPAQGDEADEPFPMALAMVGAAFLLLAATALFTLWLTPVLGLAATLAVAVASGALASHQGLLLYRTLTGELFPPPDAATSGLSLAVGTALAVALTRLLRRRASMPAAGATATPNVGQDPDVETDVASWEEDWSGAKTLLDGLRRAQIDDVAGYLRDNPAVIEMARDAVRRSLDDAPGTPSDTPSLKETFDPKGDTNVDYFAELLISLVEGKLEAEVSHSNWSRFGEQSVTKVGCAVSEDHADDWCPVALWVSRRRRRKTDGDQKGEATPRNRSRPRGGFVTLSEDADQGSTSSSRVPSTMTRRRAGPIGKLFRRPHEAKDNDGHSGASEDEQVDTTSLKTLRRKMVDLGEVMQKSVRREARAASLKPPSVNVSAELVAFADPKLVKRLNQELIRHALSRAGGAANVSVELDKHMDSGDEVFGVRIAGAELDWTDGALASARQIIQHHGGHYRTERDTDGVTLYFTLEQNSDESKRTATSGWRMASG